MTPYEYLTMTSAVPLLQGAKPVAVRPMRKELRAKPRELHIYVGVERHFLCENDGRYHPRDDFTWYASGSKKVRARNCNTCQKYTKKRKND